MKKTLLLFIALIGFFSSATYAQSISIVGSGVNGWPPDNNPEIVLSTTDNIIYTIEDLVVSTGEVKFRENMAWTNNWGGSAFPTGTAVFNSGSNIPTVAGTYDVTFNRNTLEYSFVGTSAFPSIGIIGTVLGGNGFDGADVDMITSDGENYILSAYTLLEGELKFRQDDAWTINWGNTANTFPTGIATQNEFNISVPAGTYTIHFNRLTGAYSFDYVSIGFLGTVLGDGGFGFADVDLETTDGVAYSKMNYPLLAGEIKFRQDNSWTVNWGGDALIGIANQGGNNIAVATAGNYDISFDRSTLAYSITPNLSTKDFTARNIKVYPNPSKNIWNFSSESVISIVQIIDVLGKTVLTSNFGANDVTIDASSLTEGMYFAKITAANISQTIKVIKK
ncbi:T9SS type A sorting domain-containing protein [Flavobacterium sp. PLA-1-15]|uniref:T9SS type A sorting domain-containing protein n=1 Tax=Flavobacterium sp. PLA-1-15 TaxID=3380533 RepID=UPI003B82552B